MDNEASASLKKYNKHKDIEYQLVPQHIHRVNAAERAIMKWKYHSIAGISSTETRFPMNLWCRIIPQVTMKINTMRPCRRNSTMLAYIALEGKFDFNKIPRVPLGINVIVHENINSIKLGG